MNETKKIAIIGANEFQLPLIRAANARGYQSHVFAWEQGAVGKAEAAAFYPLSITEKEAIAEQCRAIGVDAVCSIGSDLAVVTVNYVADALALPANGVGSTLCCTNKYAMRQALQAAGLGAYIPRFCKAAGEEQLARADALRYPLIVKPTDRSGSRGIFKVQNQAELREAFRRSAPLSFEKACVVEEFFAGAEYSCESISQNGTHHFLAITQKFTTGAPHFIETGHLQPAGLSAEQARRVYEILGRALTALGIRNSAAHAEFRLNEAGELCIMEIGARMGGDCIGSGLVPRSTGHDFVGYVLDVALGLPLRLVQRPHFGAAAIRFVMEPAQLQQLETIRAEAPGLIQEVSEMEPMTHAVEDSSTRYGYYILAGESKEELLRRACLQEGGEGE